VQQSWPQVTSDDQQQQTTFWPDWIIWSGKSHLHIVNLQHTGRAWPVWNRSTQRCSVSNLRAVTAAVSDLSMRARELGNKSSFLLIRLATSRRVLAFPTVDKLRYYDGRWTFGTALNLPLNVAGKSSASPPNLTNDRETLCQKYTKGLIVGPTRKIHSDMWPIPPPKFYRGKGQKVPNFASNF